MKIVPNEARVKKESRLAKAGIYGSLAVLLGGLVLTLFGTQRGLVNDSNLMAFYAIYAGILLLGLMLSRFGMYYGNRHLSPYRPETQMRDHMRGLDKRYALLLFQEPHDYMLVEPGGVTAVVYKNQTGLIKFDGSKWGQAQGFFTRVLGRSEALGDPKLEMDAATTKVAAFLKEKLPGVTIPVRGMIVFGHPEARLQVPSTPFAVIKADGVKDYLRGAGKWKELPTGVQRQMREVLGAPAVSEAA
jgi:hypothetical protein